jgi:hypothetical protein
LSQLLIQGRARWLDLIGDASRIGLAIIQAGDRTPYAIIVSVLCALSFIPIPDRFESNPTLASGVWIVATMPSRIQSDLEAVLQGRAPDNVVEAARGTGSGR